MRLSFYSLTGSINSVIKFFPFVLACILILCSIGCIKQDFPEIEDITQGGKWNLSIGDSHEEVYQKLQELGIEKEFQLVAIIGRTAYENPSEIKDYFPYYHWLTIQNTEGRVDRVLVGLDSGRVSSLYAGGAMLDSLGQWPVLSVGEAVIRQSDTYEELGLALEAIHGLSQYAAYQYLLPDKPLDLPFDPGMKDFGQWYFTFFDGTGQSGIMGRSQVRLYFEDGRLSRIHHVYDEHEVVN